MLCPRGDGRSEALPSGEAWRAGGGARGAARTPASGAWLLLAVSLAAGLVYAAVAPIISDYKLFGSVWERVLAGLDPWLKENGRFTWHAYGPVFNAFALPHALHPVLPRLLFVAAWFLAAGLVVARAASRSRGRSRLPVAAAMALGLSPLLWAQTAHFGKFDALMAALCLAAILLAERGRSIGSGLLLSAAFGLKFYALPLVPFLVFRERRLDWRLLLAFLVPSVLVFALAIAWWGGRSVGVPLVIGAARGPSFLSVFRFLVGSHSPLPDPWLPAVSRLSLPLLAAAGTAYFLVFLRHQISTPAASLLAMTLTVGLYKVGNLQLYIPVYVLSLYYLVERSEPSRGPVVGVAIFGVFINAVSLGHVLMDQYLRQWASVREWIGLPAFAVMVLLFALVCRGALEEARGAGAQGSA